MATTTNRLLLLLGLVALTASTWGLTYDPADDDWAKWEDDDDFTRCNRPRGAGNRHLYDDEEEDEDRMGANTKPNILFVLLDDWGWGDVGYHNPEVLTPNIDQLAGEGLKLEQNYVATFCTPSRAALMTGMDPIHIGRQTGVFFGSSLNGLTLSRKLLPQYMKDLNYSTHLVGKWHLGSCNSAYMPTSRGFDTQFGIMTSGGWNYPHLNYFAPYAYDFFENDQPRMGQDVEDKFQQDLYIQRTVDIIANHSASVASGADVDPLFMYLSYTSPHFPVEAPAEFFDLYPGVSDDDKRRTLLAMMSHVDAGLGRVVQALKDGGIYDDTVIVAVGDNGAYSDKWFFIPWQGGGSNAPLKGQKGDEYDGGVRVPGFIHSKLLRPRVKGKESNKMVHITDWLPTLISTAGGDLDDFPELASIDGVDQYKALFRGRCPAREAFVQNIQEVQATFPDNSTGPFSFGALRYGRWKIINQDFFGPQLPIQPIGTYQLYDMKADPNEVNDLWQQEPVVAQKMLDLWNAAVATVVAPDLAPPIAGLGSINEDGTLKTDFCNLDGTPVE